MPNFKDEDEQKAYQSDPASVPVLMLIGWLSIAGGVLIAIVAFSALSSGGSSSDAAMLPVGIGAVISGLLLLAFARVIAELRATRRLLIEIRSDARQAAPSEQRVLGR